MMDNIYKAVYLKSHLFVQLLSSFVVPIHMYKYLFQTYIAKIDPGELLS